MFWQVVSDVVFLEFLMKRHIYRASIPLENDLDVDRHRDMHPEHPMRLFTLPAQVFCTLTQLCLGVNGSQMGGVIRVSCLDAAAPFSRMEDVFLLLLAPFPPPVAAVGLCQ